MAVYQKNSRRKVVYADFTVINYSDIYPFTMSKLSKKFQTYQPDLFYDPATHSFTNNFRFLFDDFIKYCLVDLIIVEANTSNMLNSKREQQFSTVTNFLNTIRYMPNYSGGVYTQELKIRIYSYVDEDIPTITKIGGYNAFYSSLCTSSRMEKSGSIQQAKDLSILDNYPQYKAFCQAAWLNVWGITVTDAMYDPNAMFWLRTLWIQKNKNRKLYNLPPVTNSTSATIGTGDFTNRTTYDHVLAGIPGTPSSSYYSFINSSYGSVNTKTFSTILYWNNDGRYTLKPEAYSSIICYGIETNNERAIYIKPLGGLDTFQFSKFDTNKYRLEAVFDQMGKRSRWKIITIDSGSGHDVYTNRVRRDQLWLGGKRTVSGTKKQTVPRSGWKIRFYLRELESGLISSLSEIGIEATIPEKAKSSLLDMFIKRF